MEIRTIKQDTATTETENTPKGKVIKKSYIARQLLREGHRIIDIKADAADPEKKRSVFIFEATPEFQASLDKIMEERKRDREADFEERVRREVEARLKAMSEE